MSHEQLLAIIRTEVRTQSSLPREQSTLLANTIMEFCKANDDRLSSLYNDPFECIADVVAEFVARQ